MSEEFRAPGAPAELVRFRRPSDDATGRSRKVAAKMIADQIRKIAAGAIFDNTMWPPTAELWVGRLGLTLSRTEAGTYFRIDGDGRGPLMSGYLDPRPAGHYDDGRLHVMSWRRGWEAELFSTDIRPLTLARVGRFQ